MRFNVVVKMVLRVAAFLGGIALGTFIVGLLNDIFPWFWLPTLLALAVGAVSACQPWLKAQRLSFWFPSCLGFAAALTFSMSTLAVTSRFGTTIPHLALFGLGACLGMSLVFFLARGWTTGRATVVWLLIPIMAAFIVGYVSGGIGGANHMIDFLVRTFHLSEDTATTIIRIVRKTIHFSAYGIVGLAAFRGAIAGKAQRRQAVFFALLTVLCIASFDEMRQTTAPNRSGSPWDVLLDMTGAFVFVVVAALMTRAPAKGKARKAVPKPPRATG